jgi:hypothetical protein
MPMRRISKTTIDSLICRPGKDREIVWDDRLKGFGCGGSRSIEFNHPRVFGSVTTFPPPWPPFIAASIVAPIELTALRKGSASR